MFPGNVRYIIGSLHVQGGEEEEEEGEEEC